MGRVCIFLVLLSFVVKGNGNVSEQMCRTEIFKKNILVRRIPFIHEYRNGSTALRNE